MENLLFLLISIAVASFVFALGGIVSDYIFLRMKIFNQWEENIHVDDCDK